VLTLKHSYNRAAQGLNRQVAFRPSHEKRRTFERESVKFKNSAGIVQATENEINRPIAIPAFVKLRRSRHTELTSHFMADQKAGTAPPNLTHVTGSQKISNMGNENSTKFQKNQITVYYADHQILFSGIVQIEFFI
jgi:hypothetical protein